MKSTDSVLKSWKAGVEAMEGISSPLGIPYYATIEITNQCNFKCVHCQIPRASGNNLMTCAEICSVLDQLADIGALGLLITGGEPLARPDFFKILEHVRKREFAILQISTNGSLITPDIARRLADFFPMAVAVSIYGMDEKTYRSITGLNGIFHRVICNIETLAKARLPVLVRMPILKENIGQVGKAKSFARKLGVSFTTLVEIRSRYDGCHDPLGHLTSDEQLENFFRKNPEYCKPINDIFTGSSQPLCDAGRCVVAISAHGEIMPCALLRSDVNIRNFTIREVFKNNPLFRRIRKFMPKDLTECVNCKDSSYCMPCPGSFFLENKSYTVPALNVKCRITAIRKRIHQELKSQ